MSGSVGVNHVTRAELARRAGVSRAAITKACRGPLREAVASNGVALDHPAVVAYLGRRNAPPQPDINALADAVARVLVRRLMSVQKERKDV